MIPGNDDSSRAIRLYARGAADAILEGKSTVIQEIVQGGDEFVEVAGRSVGLNAALPDNGGRGPLVLAARNEYGAARWRKSPQAW